MPSNFVTFHQILYEIILAKKKFFRDTTMVAMATQKFGTKLDQTVFFPKNAQNCSGKSITRFMTHFNQFPCCFQTFRLLKLTFWGFQALRPKNDQNSYDDVIKWLVTSSENFLFQNICIINRYQHANLRSFASAILEFYRGSCPKIARPE